MIWHRSYKYGASVFEEDVIMYPLYKVGIDELHIPPRRQGVSHCLESRILPKLEKVIRLPRMALLLELFYNPLRI